MDYFLPFVHLKCPICMYFKLDNVRIIRYNYGIETKERSKMTLEEYKAYVLATRKENAIKAMSALSTTISTTKKGGN